MSCSTQPLKWAARNPRKTPSVADKMVLMKATSKLMRMDASKRDRTSRPSSSVPSQWLADPPLKIGGENPAPRALWLWGDLAVGIRGQFAGQQCDAEYGQRPQAAQQHQRRIRPQQAAQTLEPGRGR